MNSCCLDQREWLETDGLGGFASGTASGVRTRRYHGLLLAATTPPTGRFMLVNGIDATIWTPDGSFPLSSQRYGGNDVVAPEGYKLIEAFDHEPWPTWRYRLPDGSIVEQELFVTHGQPVTAMSWRLVSTRGGPVRLKVRPFLSGRDYHALHHENPVFKFDAAQERERVTWRPYAGVPAVVAYSNGRYAHRPTWYRNYYYQEEQLRGFDASEDLAAPGVFEFELTDANEAVLILVAQTDRPIDLPGSDARICLNELRSREARRRNGFASSLRRAGDQYLVRRGDGGRTIIAGYPWFADWGRDTFIALRGLCLATGRLDDAREVLTSWAKHVSLGMLPNRFPDRGEAPEYNSVDASLWYVIAVCEYLYAQRSRPFRAGYSVEGPGPEGPASEMLRAIELILDGYTNGTRHGIRMDPTDGLLFAGAPGVQLTWMDSKVGDWVVTPRHGKPVEVQALWINALSLASSYFSRFEAQARKAATSFRARFWNEAKRCLFDVVDDGFERGNSDARLRPNQIYAVGGLPLVLLDDERARAVVDAVERSLLTPIGLRSLGPEEQDYKPRYTGGPVERDSAYHQGTVWPYLIGPFVEAWVRVRGNTPQAKREARERFLEPLLKRRADSGLGHVPEIADAQGPHMPRGCPFQAWSVAEVLRARRF